MVCTSKLGDADLHVGCSWLGLSWEAAGAGLPVQSHVTLYDETSTAKLWTHHCVSAYKCISQEVGPGGSENMGFSEGAAQFKCKIPLGILSMCVLIHTPQLLKKKMRF